MKINKYIEIVRSDIAGLSSLSRVSAEAVQIVLAKHYSHVQIRIVNDPEQLAALKDDRPDLVFLGTKFILRHAHLGDSDLNKLWITDYLDEHDIRYTGSPGNAVRLDQDKSLAKRCMQSAGINTSHFIITNPASLPRSSEMPFDYPMFIKPPKLGGGKGVDEYSVARNYKDFCAKVSSIAEKHGADSLVEEYLTGREFSVAVLMNEHTGVFQTMPIELIPNKNDHGDRVLSKVVKSANVTTVRLVKDVAVNAEVCQLAIDAFNAIGARDYGRIDIRLNNEGKAQFLEANLIPSIIEGYGSFPISCLLNANLAYEDMILQIVRLGLKRSTHIPPEMLADGDDTTLPGVVPDFIGSIA